MSDEFLTISMAVNARANFYGHAIFFFFFSLSVRQNRNKIDHLSIIVIRLS